MAAKRFVRAHWPFGVIALLALLLRLLIFRDLWLDEFASLFQADTPSILETMRRVSLVHPPLYHALLHYWISFFGTGMYELRLLSVIIGMMGVLAMYVLAYKLFGRTAAIVASLFLALSPFHVWYSQETRMYVLLFLLTCLSLYFFFDLMKKVDVGTFVAFGSVTALATATHYTGALLLVLEIAYALYYWGRGDGRPINGEQEGRPLRQWLYVGAGTALFILPVALFFLVKALETQSGYVTPINVSHSFAIATTTLGELLAGYHSRGTLSKLGAAWPLAIYLGTIVMLGYKTLFDWKTKTLAWLIAATVGVLAVAAYFYPLFSPRYLTIAVPPALLLLARAVTKPDGRLRLPAVVLVSALLLVATLDQTFGGSNILRYDNKAALGYVAKNATTKDLVLYTPPYLDLVVNYYYPEDAAQAHPIPEGALFEAGAYGELSLMIRRYAMDKERAFLITGFEDEDPRVPLAVSRTIRGLKQVYPYAKAVGFENLRVICFSLQRGCRSGKERTP